MAELSPEHRAMLDFERHHWRFLATKEDEVRERFGIGLADYEQELSSLLDRPEAVAYAPATVRRLRRLRQRRLAERRESRASA